MEVDAVQDTYGEVYAQLPDSILPDELGIEGLGTSKQVCKNYQ